MANSEFPAGDLPECLHPREIVKAVKSLQGDNQEQEGVTSDDIIGYFNKVHKEDLTKRGLKTVLEAMLRVLVQKGHLTKISDSRVVPEGVLYFRDPDNTSNVGATLDFEWGYLVGLDIGMKVNR